MTSSTETHTAGAQAGRRPAEHRRSIDTQVYSVYIKAEPQAIWDAITQPEWTERFGYGGRSEYDLRPGGAVRGWTSPRCASTARLTSRSTAR